MPFLTAIFVETGNRESSGFLDSARAGDAEAFCEVCRAYETRLLGQAMNLCGQASMAEDLVQDTLVEAWKSLRRYNGRCQFFTWLCAILHHRHRNLRRARRPTAFSFLDIHDQSEVEANSRLSHAADPAPDRAALDRERAALLAGCVESLSFRHQQVIYLRFYVDDSLEEIAEALGCSLGTVKSRIFYALDKLRGMQTVSNLTVNRGVAPVKV